jgi:hypothetical protein
MPCPLSEALSLKLSTTSIALGVETVSVRLHGTVARAGEGRGLVPGVLWLRERWGLGREGHCHFELGIYLHGAFWPRADGGLLRPLGPPSTTVHHSSPYDLYMWSGLPSALVLGISPHTCTRFHCFVTNHAPRFNIVH